jgi:hypothetical protein
VLVSVCSAVSSRVLSTSDDITFQIAAAIEGAGVLSANSLVCKYSFPSPPLQIRGWTSQLSKESRGIDREIRTIQREQDKMVRTCGRHVWLGASIVSLPRPALQKIQLKQAATKGQKSVATTLAKSIVKTRVRLFYKRAWCSASLTSRL